MANVVLVEWFLHRCMCRVICTGHNLWSGLNQILVMQITEGLKAVR